MVVDREALIGRATQWYRVEERLARETAVTGALRIPVNIIVHTIQQMNAALVEDRFFITWPTTASSSISR